MAASPLPMPKLKKSGQSRTSVYRSKLDREGATLMAYWLLKTEPEEYSWDDLKKKGAKGDAWTGVRNFTARNHLKAMKKGDRTFIYHTGDEKQVVGVAEGVRESYPDPTDERGVFLSVDVKALEPLPKPVTLAAVKADKK